MLETLSRSVFSWVFPLQCQLCSSVLPSQNPTGICPSCQKTLRFIPAPHCRGCGRTVVTHAEKCERCLVETFHFDRAFACVFYESEIKNLLHCFKFARKKFLGRFFSEAMIKFAARHVPPASWDLAVPVPIDGFRKNERGFDQAKLLSLGLARKFFKPHESGALRCATHNRPQAFLGKKERRANARGRFFVPDPSKVAGRRILLIDDILTTGQTFSACAKALKAAGARAVTALAFARGI